MTSASLVGFQYAKNTWGAYAAVPSAASTTMLAFPLTRETLEQQHDNITSPTIDPNRQPIDDILVGRREIGDFEGVLSYGAYDPLLEYGMYSASVVAAHTAGSLTVTVTAGSGTFAATGIGTSVAEGDWIRLSGFVSTLVGNNGWWKVATTSTDSITVSGGTGTLASGTSGATVTRVRGWYLVAGTTGTEIYLEKIFGGLTSTAQIIAAYGCFISKLRMESSRKGLISCRFSILGSHENVIAATAASSVTAVTSNIQLNTVDHFTAVVGGVVLPLTQFNLDLSNNQEAEEVMGSFGPVDIAVGRLGITGDMQAYCKDAHIPAILNKYHDSTEVPFGVVAYDKSGSPSPLGNSYVFDIPANKFRSSRVNAEGNDTQVFIRATWASKRKLEGSTYNTFRIFGFA